MRKLNITIFKGIKDLLKKNRLLILSIILTIILYFYPINSLFFKVLFLLSILFIFLLLTINFKKQKLIIFLLLIIPITFILLPGRSFDKNLINQIYTENLKKYEGVKYVRGGENGFGIDCSGLGRRALINTYRNYGIKTFNGYLIRKAILIWWYDTSANALLNSYRNQSTKILESKSINSIDSIDLKPGYFVVSSDGIHVLNYIGEGKWIEAAPNEMKVIIVKTPSKNYWFNLPVTLMKWNY